MSARSTAPARRRKPQCTKENCDRDAIFGVRGAKAERCGDHKKSGQIALYARCCWVCGRAASHGHPEEQIRKHCSRHKQEGEVNLKDPHCRMCDTVASFRIGDGPLEWCIRHLPVPSEVTKPAPMLRGLKFCDFESGCRTRACFGPEGGIVHRCSTHRLEGYINLRVRTCEQCQTAARYGYVTEDGERQKARWCWRHAPDGAVFLQAKKYCLTDGCEYIAWYGPTKKDFHHCRIHRTEEDILFRHTSCTHCDKRALWGAPSNNRQRTKVRCYDHRLPTDVSYRPRKGQSF